MAYERARPRATLADPLLKSLSIMFRNVAKVSLISLCLVVAACAADDESSAPAPTALTSEGVDAAAPSEPGPMVSPLATSVAPPPPPAPAPAVESEPATEDAGAAAPMEDASVPADAEAPPAEQDSGVIVVVPLLFGSIHVTEKSGAICNYRVDGVDKGTSTSLDLALGIGQHSVACITPDRSTSKSVTVTFGATTDVVLELPAPPAPVENGTLVAVAVGGTCGFSVNGAFKGSGSSLKLSVPAGTYSVTCKPGDGSALKSRSVIIKGGDTAMAMFKLAP